MGQWCNINSNLLPSVIVGLRDRFGLKQFVETGTCYGHTTMLAALAFKHVITTEIAPTMHADAVRRLKSLPHVSCLNCDSRSWLKTIDWAAERPTMFYLDAHAQNEIPFTYKDRVPLHDELRLIGGLFGKHCIVIDDFPVTYVREVSGSWRNCYEFNSPVVDDHQWCALTPEPCNWSAWL